LIVKVVSKPGASLKVSLREGTVSGTDDHDQGE